MAKIAVVLPSLHIRMDQMVQGQYGRIVDSCCPNNGEIVLCAWGDRCVSLESGESWSWRDPIGCVGQCSVMVEILPAGTKIGITV